MSNKVLLESSDGKRFEIDREVAFMSLTIKNMLEDLAGTDAPIPLPNVDGTILQHVVDYCEYHHAHPGEAEKRPEKNKVDSFCEWDTKFIAKLSEPSEKLFPLFRTILAANYLDIKTLLDILCRAVAGMIKGKTPDQICDTFSIKKDATEQEKEEVRAANKWIDEL
eukprot:m51a1_g1239 putative cytosolic glycoprotein fp21 (166) ;mRNA; r:552036-552843